MKRDLVQLLCCPDCHGDLALHDETPARDEVDAGALRCAPCGASYPILRGVPRFVDSDQYVGSFSYEWNRWKTAQLDVVNGRRESEETFAEKTGFSREELQGRLVLDVGCGAGRFLDVASRWGARVVGIDLSLAVEASQENVGRRPNVSVIQADVFRLPFRPGTFDAIFSIGVLHHSRDTREAFLRLPPLLKANGDLAVWLYYYTDRLYCAASDVWRTVCRPFPLWAVHLWCRLLVAVFSDLWATPLMSRRPWGHLRRVLPVNTHPDRQWRVLDTFDWYSPRYQDKDCSPERVLGWCQEGGIRDVRILSFPTAIRGRRDSAGALPLVRWSMPDLRTSRVLVFGAGAGGLQAVRFLRDLAPACVVGLVDNDPAKQGLEIEGLRVGAFVQVPRDWYDFVVIASLPGRMSIAAQLRDAGLIEHEQFLDAEHVQLWYELVRAWERMAA